MKKILSVVLSIIAIGSLFTACHAKNIDVRQAYSLIKSYSIEELGLTQQQLEGAQYGHMDDPVTVDGVEYYEITISNISKTGETDKDGNEFYSFNDIGVYYVTLDGEAAYSKNIETGELTELPKKEVPELTDAQKEEIKEAKKRAKESK